jgi:hypothetical protein
VDGNLESVFNYASKSFLSEVDQLCHGPTNHTSAPAPSPPSNPDDGFGLGAMVGLAAGAAALIGVGVVCYLTPAGPPSQPSGQAEGYAVLPGGESADDAVALRASADG